MGRIFLIDLEGDFYSCKHCRTPLALAEQFISMPAIHCIFSDVVNVFYGEIEWLIIQGIPSSKTETLCVTCGCLLGRKVESVYVEPPGYRFYLKRSEILAPGEEPDVPPA